MARPRLPYLIRRVSRHGVTCWYFWRRPGKQIRIRGEYGTPEFLANYEAARGGGSAAPAPLKDKTGSLTWLIARHRESIAWIELSEATRRQRENLFKRIIAKFGDTPVGSIRRIDVVATLDSLRDRPSAANNFLAATRGLYGWAVNAGLAPEDPTIGIKKVRRTGPGFHQWTEEEVAAFEARWPVGTRERLALSLLLYTGLRRGDVVRVGRQHVKDGVIHLRTEKTGTAVALPILPALQAVLDATPGKGDLAFIARLDGRPMVKESFGTWFKEACKAAGVPGSAHGLRKLGATRAAEDGATVHQLNALFGWEGTAMASLYTAKADRVRLAQGAIHKLKGRTD